MARHTVETVIRTPWTTSLTRGDLVEMLAACERHGMGDTETTITFELKEQGERQFFRLIARRPLEQGL